MGFFCTAGPLKIFVSTHLIPEDFTYDTGDDPAFVSEDEQVRIKAGSEVRVRLVGVRLDANECVSPRRSAGPPCLAVAWAVAAMRGCMPRGWHMRSLPADLT